MSKKAKWIVIAVVLSMAVGGVAFAAWQVTKSTHVQGVVAGTFTLQTGTCNGAAISGQAVRCDIPVRNDYTAAITLDELTVEANQVGITFTELTPVGTTIAAGATNNVSFKFTPGGSTPLGPVDFTVTAKFSAQ